MTCFVPTTAISNYPSNYCALIRLAGDLVNWFHAKKIVASNFDGARIVPDSSGQPQHIRMPKTEDVSCVSFVCAPAAAGPKDTAALRSQDRGRKHPCQSILGHYPKIS